MLSRDQRKAPRKSKLFYKRCLFSPKPKNTDGNNHKKTRAYLTAKFCGKVTKISVFAEGKIFRSHSVFQKYDKCFEMKKKNYSLTYGPYDMADTNY